LDLGAYEPHDATAPRFGGAADPAGPPIMMLASVLIAPLSNDPIVRLPALVLLDPAC
jgi:hypothetical protein